MVLSAFLFSASNIILQIGLKNVSLPPVCVCLHSKASLKLWVKEYRDKYPLFQLTNILNLRLGIPAL